MKVLWNFGLHGLGDHMMFGCVLRHIKHYFPERIIHVLTTKDKGSVLLEDADWVCYEEPPSQIVYDSIEILDWPECYKTYPDFPSTKAVAFLRDYLRVEPIKELLRYRVRVPKVDVYPSDRIHAVFHYKGITNPSQKDLDEEIAGVVKDVILKTVDAVWIPAGATGVSTLIGFMAQSRINICIDSGPQKIALALADSGGPPCVAVWTGHHPIHYCDFADNTIHIVPVNHPSKVRGDWSVCKDFFYANYRHKVYSNVRELVSTIGEAVKELVG